jgi:hypothetical protein
MLIHNNIFTREKLQAKHIQFTYISIVVMTIDILTNSFPKEKHFHYVSNLGMDFVSPSKDYPHSQPISHALMAYVGVFPTNITHQEYSLTPMLFS